MAIQKIKKDLNDIASEERRLKSLRFFKFGVGDYGEGDFFIGVSTPDMRRIATTYLDATFADLEKLVTSKIHEERFVALLILVGQMKRAVKVDDAKVQKDVYDFYLAHRAHVNNWDLVDVSAHYIVGQYILLHPRESKTLYKLVKSDVLWDRRIAMVSQWLMIREGVYDHVLPLAKILLHDEEDLMHKAVGWMLRELWKKDAMLVEDFLQERYEEIPRTTLRYTIERMTKSKRKIFLEGSFSG